MLGNHDWLLANVKALAFLAVFVYATHATQAIAFEWKPGFRGQPPTVDRQMRLVLAQCIHVTILAKITSYLTHLHTHIQCI